MKNYLIFASLFLLLIGCNTAPPTETELYIYLDFTEGQDYTQQLEEDLDNYAALMGIEDGGSANYGKVKVLPLHDLSSAKSKTIKLKQGKSDMERNEFIRKKETDKFKGQLLDLLQELNTNYTGKELKNSHLFEPICKGIKKLNKSDADRKIILIYSDMLENSDIANFHSKSGSTEKWTNQFNEACDPEDAADLEIFVVYPIDKNNDEKINKAADFWASYFADKGMDEDAFHFETGIDL